MSLSEPFYTGTLLTAPPRSAQEIALAGRTYLIDWRSGRFKSASDPVQRPQQDTGERPGEATLAVNGPWRRAQTSWEHGAGQDFYDRADADPLRFDASRGVDPWTPWQLTLLHSAEQVSTQGNSLAVTRTEVGEPRLVVGGTDAIAILEPDGSATALAATVTDTVRVTSTGATVYAASGAGIHTLNADHAGWTAYNVTAGVQGADVFGFVKGRLLVGVGQDLFDVVGSGAPTALAGSPRDAAWAWTGLAAGPTHIYACGYAGDRGAVYRIGVKEDATGLDALLVAAELPDGEVPLAVTSYLGLVLIGTSRGVRLAEPAASGALTVGALLETGPCRCFEPQERFVWFGQDVAFEDASGLGRLDLTQFTSPLAPAYATDLMGATVGDVVAAVTFDERRWFIAGDEVHAETATTLASGWLTSGWVTFGVDDPKALQFADVVHSTLAAGESVLLEHRAFGSETYTLTGQSAAEGSTRPTRFSTGSAQAAAVSTRVSLLASATAGPALTRVEITASVAPPRSHVIYLPILLAEAETVGMSARTRDVRGERSYLEGLMDAQRVVAYQEGDLAFSVTIADYEWVPEKVTRDGTTHNGTLVLKLQRL